VTVLKHHAFGVDLVGARCAGSPTAMLLSRKGHRVLLVDRATFPSDTISTHVVQPTGVAALNRWGLLDRLTATGCPPVSTYTFDFGPFTISGSPGTEDSPVAYAPRRIILDKLLVDAAATTSRTSSWRRKSLTGFAPPSAKPASLAPPCRTSSAKPYGPRWALVGDAGYNKDFITAQGISDAFRDAQLCAIALDETFSGVRSFDDAMGDYQATRDGHVLPMYEFTTQIATLEPPPPELQQLLGAVHGNQDAMDGFARVNAGVTSPAEFFSEENVGRIFSTSGPNAGG
jgi:2-polyprenyl-6-methoxyphenol hydroxylase-like FAD-dependent oxidoreductase